MLEATIIQVLNNLGDKMKPENSFKKKIKNEKDRRKSVFDQQILEKKHKNKLEKKIRSMPYYDILSINSYRLSFGYDARLWYNFTNMKNPYRKSELSEEKKVEQEDSHSASDERDDSDKEGGYLEDKCCNKSEAMKMQSFQKCYILKVIYMPYMTKSQMNDFDFNFDDKTIMMEKEDEIKQGLKQIIGLGMGTGQALGFAMGESKFGNFDNIEGMDFGGEAGADEGFNPLFFMTD